MNTLTTPAGFRLSEVGARVLEGIAAGASTAQLAHRLFLSKQGIEYHVSAMLRAFGVANRSELVARAYVVGVLAVGVWPPQVSSAATTPRREVSISASR